MKNAGNNITQGAMKVIFCLFVWKCAKVFILIFFRPFFSATVFAKLFQQDPFGR